MVTSGPPARNPSDLQERKATEEILRIVVLQTLLTPVALLCVIDLRTWNLIQAVGTARWVGYSAKTSWRLIPEASAKRRSCSSARARVGPMLPIGMDSASLMSL